MKSLSLKRNSWHHWLAVQFKWEEGYRTYSDEENKYIWVTNDFCSYVRRIIFGCLLSLLGGAAILFVLSGVLWGEVEFFWYVYQAMICGNSVKFPELAGLAMAVNILGFGAFLAISINNGWLEIFVLPNWLKWCFKWAPKIRIPDCDEIPICNDTRRFLLATYATFHDKVCFKLDFHNKEEQQSDS